MAEQLKITIPFTDEELDKYFDDIEDYQFLVDVNGSAFRGKKLLTYIYNSGMSADILVDSFSEKLEELVLAYLQADVLVDIQVLDDICVDILEYFIGKDAGASKEYEAFIRRFVEKHGDVLEETAIAIESLKTNLMGVAFGEKDESKADASFEKIGKNIISLRNAEDFWGLAADLEDKNIEPRKYKELQDNVFEGKKASWYFLNEFNPISVMYMARLSPEDSLKEFEDELQEIAQA